MTAPSLLTEVEVLRRRLVEMEGKDEELVRMAEQCRELDRRLATEDGRCRGLKTEVDKLSGRIGELDRIEEALGRSRQDCFVLRNSLEREREVGRTLADELDALRLRVKELEAAEARLERSEMAVRQDLGKLRSLTVALVEDRKSMAEKLRQAEEKIGRRESKRNEPGNLAAMTERLQQALKSQADLEETVKSVAKERDDLRHKLEAEEETNRELQSRITTMKKKLNVYDNRKEKEETYTHGSIPNNAGYGCQPEDNKVRELTRELDVLRRRLQDKEALEGELVKLEEDLESLERRLDAEQRRTRALTEELQSTKKELSRYEQDVNQEHLLLRHLQKEQVKCRLLTREVDGLKEKLQKLTAAETSVCRAQTDPSVLQRKLAQQEARNEELVRETEELRRELQGHRTIKNRTLDERKQLSDGRRSRGGEGDAGGEPGRSTEVTTRGGSLVDRRNAENNNVSPVRSRPETANGDVMMVTHTPGQPLHIKVTPHHALNTATLEISSPPGDAAAPRTVPATGASPKQRITIIQNSCHPKTPPSSPDRTVSPSSRAVTPDNNNPPVQIVTVRTCSPEPPAEAASQAASCRTPERSNGWQRRRSGGGEMSPGIVATEDSKIHIHVGSPLNGGAPQPVGPYHVRHEQRTHIIANGSHVKSVGKITSSITISPANAPAAHSNITVSGICD